MYHIYSKMDLLDFVASNKSELETLLNECRAYMKNADKEGIDYGEKVWFMSDYAKIERLRSLISDNLANVKRISCYKKDVALLRAMYAIEEQCAGAMAKSKTKAYWRLHGQTAKYCFDNFNSNTIYLMTLGEQGMPRTATLTYDTEQKKWIYNPGVLAAYFPVLDNVFTDISFYSSSISVYVYALSYPWIFVDVSKVFKHTLENGFTPKDIDKLLRTCAHLLQADALI